MECKQPNIADKLVPFVEGALAEPDRREVQDHLPQCPVCSAEVKLLKESIAHLRSATARGLTYRPGTNLPAEDLVDYALFGEQMSPETRRRVQLTVLESVQLQSELSLLNELERHLAQKVEPERAQPVMPTALKQAVARTYGAQKPPAPTPIERWRSGWSRLNRGRLVLVAACFVLLVLGALGVGIGGYRALMAPRELASVSSSPTPVELVASNRTAPASASSASSESYSSNATDANVKKSKAVPVASATRVAASRPVATPAAQTTQQVAAASAPPPPAAKKPTTADKLEVAVYEHHVDQEDVKRLAGPLIRESIPYSYHDGQLYVAKNDLPRASAVLSRYEQDQIASKRQATSAVAYQPPFRSARRAPSVVSSYYSQSKTVIQPPRSAAIPVPVRRSARAVQPGSGYQAPPAREIASAVASSNTAGWSIPRGRVAHIAPHPDRSRAARLEVRKVSAKLRPVQSYQRPSARVQPKLVRPRPFVLAHRSKPEVVARAKEASPPSESALAAVGAPTPKSIFAARSSFAQKKPRKADTPPPLPTEILPPTADVAASTAPAPLVAPQAGSAEGAVNGMAPSLPVPSDPVQAQKLKQARIIVARIVGDAVVEIFRRTDGTYVFTIRPVHKLSSEDVEHLRLTMRKEMQLTPFDTIVIRQP